jgi:hypothetical protein
MCVVLAASLYTGCQNKPADSSVVKIGRHTVSKEEFSAFKKMQKLYPAQNPGVTKLNKGKPISVLISTYLLADKAGDGFIRKHITSTPDWEWKQRYYPAQLFFEDVMFKNLGSTDEELTAYYESHKEEFKDTIRASSRTSADTQDTDSAAAAQQAADAPAGAADSIVYKSFVDVRDHIARTLFLEKYPPDSAFYAKFVSSADSTVDSARAHMGYIQEKQRNANTFFLERVYEELTGTPYVDSLSAWYGKDKLITPQDMDIILSWLPEHRAAMYAKDTTKLVDLGRWLLRWKLYAQKAKETGYADRENVSTILAQAKKYDAASRYLDTQLLPHLEENVSMDTAMCRYAALDHKKDVRLPLDSTHLRVTFAKKKDQAVQRSLDSTLYSLRRAKGVTFYQSDWKDAYSKDPKEIFEQATTLRDSAKNEEAEKLFSTLVEEFSFTEYGKKAAPRLAKILSERGKHTSAVDTYRDHLIFNGSSLSTEEKSTVFFMIGFIYDEHRNWPEPAELNYKWVLRHSPESELADDAEFMTLHLDEPMCSIEELRAQARRQGQPTGEDAAAL